MDEQTKRSRGKTWTEEIEVAGGHLIERIRAVIAEGNVREVRVKAPGGKVILDMPLTAAAIAGGALAVAAPWLAMLSAIAAMVARVRLEVVREGTPNSRLAGRKTASKAAKGTATKRAKASRPRGRKRVG
jgi:hypothetical protein